MRKIFTFSFLCLLYSASVMGQGVGIGTVVPDASAKLDISASNKGLLIPRINLVGNSSPAPISNPAVGLMVYNTNASLSNGEGFYYWDGAQWIKFSTSSPGNFVQNQNGSAQTGNFWLSGNGHLGSVQITNLGGSGAQMVVTDNNGHLSTQALPTDAQNLIYNPTTGLLSIDNGNSVDLSSLNTDNQNLSLSGNNLNISNGTGVNLAPYLDNTDAQTLTISGGSLSISGGNSVALTSLDAQDLTLTGNTLAVSNDATTVDLTPYLDNTDAQAISLSGNTLGITGNATTVDLTTFLDNTDAQTLTISGGNLSISGGNSVALTSLDAQDLTLTGNTLAVSNDATTVDLTPYLDNTDAQAISLSGNTLGITGNAATVNLAPYLDNTDAQAISLTGNTLGITGNAATVDLTTFLDNTDAQTLTIAGGNLSISGGNSVALTSLDAQDLTLTGNTLAVSNDATTVDLTPYLDNTDAQAISLSGNTLGITGNAATVNLAPYLDNTDAQVISLTGNTLGITGNAATVDLTTFLDNTDAQAIALTGNTLGITGNATTVDLTTFLDNTDAQTLTIAGGNLSISGGNSVALTSLDAQDLTLTGNTLAVSNDATTVDLTPFLDNTDAQAISLSGNTLGITGNAATVNLAPYLDNTDAQAISLTGNTLGITGNAATVDLTTFLDNTDAQTLTIAGGNLSISGGNSVALTSLDAQDLTLTGNTLAVSNDATTVDLTPYLDNTDAQAISLSGNTLGITGNTATVDLTTFLDNTDAQTLTIAGGNLSISGGNSVALTSLDAQDLTLTGNTLAVSNDATTVDLTPYLDNTDAQAISLTGNTLGITGNATTVDLTTFLDNTDAQTLTIAGGNLSISGGNSVALTSLDAQDLTLTGNTLAVSNDATTVDLTPYLDNTDAQAISLSGNTLGITGNAATVNLAPYLDNTDAQTLTIAGGNLSISGGNSVALTSLDAQDLTLTGNTLAVSNDATSVDLTPYLDNTDAQTLTVSGNNLSISGGNTIALPSVTSGDIASTTSGVTITNGTGRALGGNVSVDIAINSATTAGLVTPTTGLANKIWASNGSGVPDWRDGNSLLTTKDVTTSTTGLTVGNGIGQIVGAANVTVDYDLPMGIGALASGSQGLLGGSGAANTYIGADGQQHLLPPAGAGTTNTLTSSGNAITSTVNGVAATTDAVNSVSNAISGTNILTTTVNGIASTGVDLTPYIDNTDAQAISLTGNTLGISGNASTVDLAPYLDNTDAQAISLTGNTLGISGNASTVDLAPYLDNTDAQTLSYNATNGDLTISTGNTVNIPISTGDITNVTAGAGLTGGATSGNANLDIGAGNGITVNADDIAVKYDNASIGLNGSGQLEVKNYLPSTRTLTINGTTNQITVGATNTQDLSTDRTWTISTPQDIHTAATPTFSDLTLSANNVNGGVVYTTATGNLNTSAAGTVGQVLQSNGAAAPSWVTLPAGTVYTANNGLTMTANNTQLGGTLVQNTTINQASFNQIQNTGTGNYQIQGNGTTTFHVESNGNVGVGISSASGTQAKLDVRGGAIIGDYNASGFFNSNAAIHARKNGVNAHLILEKIGANTGGLATTSTGMVVGGERDIDFRTGVTAGGDWNTTGASRMFVSSSTGNVGIGQTNPTYGLELNGTFGFGNGTAGSYRSRTETRDNAGLQASQSGMFETSVPAPAANWYPGASSWQHLLDVRHSNNTNNYAMQMAGSFFDQDFWVRKTNGAANTAWSRVITSSNLSATAILNQNASAQSVANFWISGNGYINGNVGIGTSAPNAKLDVVGTLRMNDNAIYLRGGTDANHGLVWNSAADGPRLFGFGGGFLGTANGTNALYWNNAGSVGIGITAPTQRLDVQGGNARINNLFIGDVGHGATWGGIANSSQASTTGYALISSSDGNYTLINKQNTGGGYIGFRVANNDVAVITNAGNMGIGTTGPGYRLSVNGAVQAIDYGASGTPNIYIGDDTYLTDLDIANTAGLYSNSNAAVGGLQLGNNAGSLLYGSGGNIGVGNTAPGVKLDVSGTVRCGNGGTALSTFGSASSATSSTNGTAYIYSSSFVGAVGLTLWGNNYRSGVQGYTYATDPGNRTAGVNGIFTDATGTWGALAYQNSGNVNYGSYSTSALGVGTGFTASENIEGVGSGAYGGVIGGWVRGEVMGQVSSGELFAAYNLGNEYTSGHQADIVTTGEERTIAYATTSTDLKINFDGSTQLSKGKVSVLFDKNFKKLMAKNTKPVIVVTPVGNSNGVYIASIDENGFTIVENNNGTSNVELNYIIIAKRIDANRNNALPRDLSNKDFDTNMKAVMFNENNTEQSASSVWWDGEKIRFDAAPAKPAMTLEEKLAQNKAVLSPDLFKGNEHISNDKKSEGKEMNK